VERPDSRSEGGLTDDSVRHGSVERPERVELAEIVDQSGPRTRPLYSHFQLGPERGAVHVLVHTDQVDDTCTACGASVARRLVEICSTRVFYRLLS
jgi:hypothetical protein